MSSGSPVPAPQRYASLIRLGPQGRAQYLELHAAVWPEVEQTIRHCNIRNYTIFEHGDLLIGYFEYHGNDFAADQERMAADPQTQRWWALTDPCQQRLPEAPPGQQWSPAAEIWHLD